MKLNVSQAATDDLEGIWLYTAEHWSMEQADRYVNLILDGFDHVGRDPSAGKDFRHVREGYFGMKVGSHLIFYRQDRTANTIEIIRVLHGRMNLDERLSR